MIAPGKTPAELESGVRALIGPAYCAELDELVRAYEVDYHRQRGLREAAGNRRLPTAESQAQAARCRALLAEFERRHGCHRTRSRAVASIANATGYPPWRVREYLAKRKSEVTRVASKVGG